MGRAVGACAVGGNVQRVQLSVGTKRCWMETEECQRNVEDPARRGVRGVNGEVVEVGGVCVIGRERGKGSESGWWGVGGLLVGGWWGVGVGLVLFLKGCM